MKASLGKIILTPPEIVGGYIGQPLAGYTPSPQCKGKYDDIMARGILIEEEKIKNVKKRMLLISLDFLKIPLLFTEYVREKIEDEYQINGNQILIHATHTHKSMDMTGEFVFGGNIQNTIKGIMLGAFHGNDLYKVWVAKEIVKLVGQLIDKLQPAKIAWTKKRIEEDILINRRHPLRRSKGDLGVISFKNSETNKIFGLMVNFGIHPTTLSHFVDKISGDYPAYIIKKIRELSNNEIEPVFFASPCGDLNPITTIGTDFEYLAKQSQDHLLGQKGDIQHTKKIGYLLGKEAFQVLNSIPDSDYFENIDFRSYVKTFWVPMTDSTSYKSPFKFSQRAIYLAKRYLLFPIALIMGDANEPNFPGFAVKHKGIFKRSSKINVYSQIQYFRLFCSSKDGTKKKELAFSGIPGEVFEDMGVGIQKRTPAGPDNTFIIQNANDWSSYLFSLKEYTTTGGYEPFASFSPITGLFVNHAYTRLLEDIEADITAGYY